MKLIFIQFPDSKFLYSKAKGKIITLEGANQDEIFDKYDESYDGQGLQSLCLSPDQFNELKILVNK